MHVGGVVIAVDVGSLWWLLFFFFFQAEDGIRDLVRSRGLGDVYKRQEIYFLEINFTCSVFYKDGYEGSADFILKFDGIGLSLIHI